MRWRERRHRVVRRPSLRSCKTAFSFLLVICASVQNGTDLTLSSNITPTEPIAAAYRSVPRPAATHMHTCVSRLLSTVSYLLSPTSFLLLSCLLSLVSYLLSLISCLLSYVLSPSSFLLYPVSSPMSCLLAPPGFDLHFPMTDAVEHFYKGLLAIYTHSFVKHLANHFAHFFVHLLTV